MLLPCSCLRASIQLVLPARDLGRSRARECLAAASLVMPDVIINPLPARKRLVLAADRRVIRGWMNRCVDCTRCELWAACLQGAVVWGAESSSWLCAHKLLGYVAVCVIGSVVK
jgi:hypothetical protein